MTFWVMTPLRLFKNTEICITIYSSSKITVLKWKKNDFVVEDHAQPEELD